MMSVLKEKEKELQIKVETSNRSTTEVSGPCVFARYKLVGS
jgi:hypothetical protein